MESKKRHLPAINAATKAFLLIVGAPLTIFGGLYLILPPSAVLPVATFSVGFLVALLAIQRGWIAWPIACLYVAIITIAFFGAVTLMARPISTGTVASNPIAQKLDQLFQGKGFSGVVLVAQDNRILLAKGYGYADRRHIIPNTMDTRFRLGSVTKQFSAMAILILHGRGQLDVQDRICPYLANCPRSGARSPFTIY